MRKFWYSKKGTAQHHTLERLNKSMNEKYNNPMEIKSNINKDHRLIPDIAVTANYMKTKV